MTIVPFAPPIEDQVTNGAPWGLRPDVVVIPRIVDVPAFSGDAAVLKFTKLTALELPTFWDDSNTMMYWLFGNLRC
jgi:hypothetical protein